MRLCTRLYAETYSTQSHPRLLTRSCANAALLSSKGHTEPERLEWQKKYGTVSLPSGE